MEYQHVLTEVIDGLAIYIPESEKVRTTYEALLLNDSLTPFPFWAKIWPAAKAMTSFLASNPNWIEDKLVLEIGAGIGLPSFTIANKTKNLIISDHAFEAVALIEKNIQLLKLDQTKAMCLDWNNFPENIKAETILLSDVNYAPEQFESLLTLIKRFISASSTIIIATPQRIMATPFVKAIEPFVKYNLHQRIIDSKQEVDVSILILYK